MGALEVPGGIIATGETSHVRCSAAVADDDRQRDTRQGSPRSRRMLQRVQAFYFTAEPVETGDARGAPMGSGSVSGADEDRCRWASASSTRPAIVYAAPAMRPGSSARRRRSAMLRSGRSCAELDGRRVFACMRNSEYVRCPPGRAQAKAASIRKRGSVGDPRSFSRPGSRPRQRKQEGGTKRRASNERIEARSRPGHDAPAAGAGLLRMVAARDERRVPTLQFASHQSDVTESSRSRARSRTPIRDAHDDLTTSDRSPGRRRDH